MGLSTPHQCACPWMTQNTKCPQMRTPPQPSEHLCGGLLHLRLLTSVDVLGMIVHALVSFIWCHLMGLSTPHRCACTWMTQNTKCPLIVDNMQKSIYRLGKHPILTNTPDNGFEYSHMCPGWIVYTVGTTYSLFRPGIIISRLFLGVHSIVDNMQKSICRLGKHPILTNTPDKWL